VVLESLRLGFFIPGAAVWDGKRLHEVRSDDDLAMAFNPFLPLSDKLRTLSWSLELSRLGYEEVWQLEESTAEEMLRGRGFSDKFLDRFARPFFGGIFLDRSLQTSSRMFSFVWKMLNEGKIGIPAEGMEAIPRQIAADLPASSLRMNAKVSSLIRHDGRIAGVRLADGEEVLAEEVVVAVEAPEAARLAGAPVVGGAKSSATVAFDAPEPIGEEALLVLNGPGLGRVNHVADISAVCPKAAPAGRRLITATILGIPSEDDLAVAKSARYEVSQMLPKADVMSWRPLKVDRIRYAQMPQPSGFRDSLPGVGGEEGLWFAGEFNTYSSIDGAILSGQECARALLGSRAPVGA
jgi:phytoene dehydrogenase-like protein